MRAKSTTTAGRRKPVTAKRLPGRIALVALAALLLGAAGASVPGHAEIQDQAALLVPATTQSTGFESAFAEFDTIETPEYAAAPGLDPGPRFEDPGREIGGGVASWYGREFAGRKTANGERFDPGQYTAAHRSLPFGSKVRVTHVASGKSVVVRINDRGPFSHGRVIDLSQAAAAELGIVRAGSGKVSLSLLSD